MQAIDNEYEEYARKNGLTFMSLYILETLYEKKICTQKEITEQTLYPKQSVNMVMRSFINNGWVELAQSAEDRRNKKVSLTPSGEAFAKSVVEPHWQAATHAFAELDSNEGVMMLDTLKRFAASIAENVSKL